MRLAMRAPVRAPNRPANFLHLETVLNWQPNGSDRPNPLRRFSPMRKKHALNEEQHRETAPEGLASTCSVLAVGLFMLTFVFQNFVIPSSSMASTLLVGDHVLVERETLAPASRVPFLHYREVKRGVVVVFYKPAEEANGEHMILVKRVIGIPCDRIHLRNGIVYL